MTDEFSRGRRRGGLGFDCGGKLLGHHALRFGAAADAAGREAHKPQRDDPPRFPSQQRRLRGEVSQGFHIRRGFDIGTSGGGRPLFPLRDRASLFSENFTGQVKISSCMPGIAVHGAGFASALAAPDQLKEHEMPNRGELPIPAMRNRDIAKSRTAQPDADAWAIIAFCVIGGLLSFCLAISSVGINGYPAMMQMPWGG